MQTENNVSEASATGGLEKGTMPPVSPAWYEGLVTASAPAIRARSRAMQMQAVKAEEALAASSQSRSLTRAVVTSAAVAMPAGQNMAPPGAAEKVFRDSSFGAASILLACGTSLFVFMGTLTLGNAIGLPARASIGAAITSMTGFAIYGAMKIFRGRAAGVRLRRNEDLVGVDVRKNESGLEEMVLTIERKVPLRKDQKIKPVKTL